MIISDHLPFLHRPWHYCFLQGSHSLPLSLRVCASCLSFPLSRSLPLSPLSRFTTSLFYSLSWTFYLLCLSLIKKAKAVHGQGHFNCPSKLVAEGWHHELHWLPVSLDYVHFLQSLVNSENTSSTFLSLPLSSFCLFVIWILLFSISDCPSTDYCHFYTSIIAPIVKRIWQTLTC